MYVTFVVPTKEIDRLIELGYLFKGKRVSKKVLGPDNIAIRVRVPTSDDQVKG